jgi:hypothetical protein
MRRPRRGDVPQQPLRRATKLVSRRGPRERHERPDEANHQCDCRAIMPMALLGSHHISAVSSTCCSQRKPVTSHKVLESGRGGADGCIRQHPFCSVQSLAPGFKGNVTAGELRQKGLGERTWAERGLLASHVYGGLGVSVA